MEYEFTFVVAGVTVDDDDAVNALNDAHDAMLLRAGGVDLITIAHEGATAVEAAMRAATAITSVSTKIRVLRLDRDLVGVPEIAERTERTRQNVAQWINGERLSSGPAFPLPEGTAGRSHVWLWSEVNEWLTHHGLGDGTVYPNRGEMTDIDHALCHTHTMSLRVDTFEDQYSEQRQAIVEEMQADHFPTFLDFLAGRLNVTDAEGRYVVVVAAPDEPAQEVMRHIAAYGHDVVLVSKTDKFVGMVISPRMPAKPMKLVHVDSGASARDWLDQVRENPTAQFISTTIDDPMEARIPIAA